MKLITDCRANTFTSTHPSNEGESLTVASNPAHGTYLVLIDGPASILVVLDPDEVRELVELMYDPPELRYYSYPKVEGVLPVSIGDLHIEYDNRGDPYVKGLSFTAGDVSVFLDGWDTGEMIDVLDPDYRERMGELEE